MFAKVIDPSAPSRTTSYILSPQQSAALKDGDCELEDLEHDVAAYVTRLEGVTSTECVVDDDGFVIAVSAEFCSHEAARVRNSIQRSIDITINVLKHFSPVLGGYR